MKLAGVRGTPKQQLALVAVAGVLFVWLYVSYAVVPLFRRATQLGREIRETKILVGHLGQAVEQAPRLRQEVEALSSRLEGLRATLPPEKELPSVIELLSDLARRSGVKIQTIFPQRTFAGLGAEPAKPAPSDTARKLYTEIPVQIDSEAGFHELGLFLNRVEASQHPMRLKSLRIASDPKDSRRHEIKIVLTVYFSSESS